MVVPPGGLVARLKRKKACARFTGSSCRVDAASTPRGTSESLRRQREQSGCAFLTHSPALLMAPRGYSPARSSSDRTELTAAREPMLQRAGPLASPPTASASPIRVADCSCTFAGSTRLPCRKPRLVRLPIAVLLQLCSAREGQAARVAETALGGR